MGLFSLDTIQQAIDAEAQQAADALNASGVLHGKTVTAAQVETAQAAAKQQGGGILGSLVNDVGDVVSTVVPASARNAIGEGLAIAICPPVAVGLIAGTAATEGAKDVVSQVAPHSGLASTLTRAADVAKGAGTAIASHPTDVAAVAAGTALVATGIGAAAGAGLLAKGVGGIAIGALVGNSKVTSSPGSPAPVTTFGDPSAAAAPALRGGFWDWLKSIFGF